MTHVRRPNRRPLSPEVAQLLQGEICDTAGKIRYPTERAALLVIDRMRPKDPRGAVLETYRHASCGDWHVGHGSRS